MIKSSKQIISLLFIILISLFSLSAIAQVETEEVAEEIGDDGGDSLEVFMFVEEIPTFPGGDEARIKFLIDNVQYPEAGIESGIQGTVFASFIVEKNGEITNVKIKRSLGEDFDNEVIRVINLMPDWIPGKQRGKEVRVQFVMPVKFTYTSKLRKKRSKKKS